MKRAVYISIILSLSILLQACFGADGARELNEGEYNIYYVNNTKTSLYPVRYKAKFNDTQSLIDELIYQFINIPKDVEAGLALDDKVIYKGYSKEGNILYLYFDTGYSNMKGANAILARAALAKTMTQIEGIDYIAIYAGEQLITDDLNKPIGPFSGNEFIDTISDVNAFDKIELILYFADESGEYLVEEKREVIYSQNTSLEKLVIDELIKGSENVELKSTIPEATKLLSVSVNDNICYLNFDENFLNIISGQRPYISIYSIVNSLSELSKIGKVQISVNGSQKVLFGESISLDTTFERNLDFLKEK